MTDVVVAFLEKRTLNPQPSWLAGYDAPPDEIIVAALEAFGELTDVQVQDKALVLKLLGLVFSSACEGLGATPPPPRPSLGICLFLADFFQQHCTTSEDQILAQIVHTSIPLFRFSLQLLLKIDTDPNVLDSEGGETVDVSMSFRTELESLHKRLGDVLGSSTVETNGLYYGKQAIVLFLSGMAEHAAMTALVLHPGGIVTEPYLKLLMETSVECLVRVLRVPACSVSLCTSSMMAIQRCIVWNSDCRKGVGAFALSAVTAAVHTMYKDRSYKMPISVSRVVRRILSDSLSANNIDLPSASVKAIESAIELLGGKIPPSVLPPHLRSEPQVIDSIQTLADWNKAFKRSVKVVADDADGAFENEEGAAGSPLLSGKRNEEDYFIETTIGTVSREVLAEMTLASLKRISLEEAFDEGRLEQRHIAGLEKMEYFAAKTAQREELARIRLQEAQSIEEVPAGKLLGRIPGGLHAIQKGTQLLARTSARQNLQKRAFLSILKSFRSLRESLSTGASGTPTQREASIRQAQALVARTVAQLPSAITDCAIDALCDLLEDEIVACQAAAAMATEDDVRKVKRREMISNVNSNFNFVIQVLFMKYAQLAPFQDAGLLVDVTASSSLEFQVNRTFQVENPIAWLFSGEMDSDLVEGEQPLKRARLEGPSRHSESDFKFSVDTADEPSPFSHFFCRFLSVFVDANRADLVLEMLSQAPAITASVWHFILTKLCLADRKEEKNVAIGVLVLSYFATKRKVYKAEALSLLVHLAGCSKSEPRRLAISAIRNLLQNKTQRVFDNNTEKALVENSRKLLSRLPLLRSVKSGGEEIDGKLHVDLHRHMDLFVMLCSRGTHTKTLFPILLGAYEECVKQGNSAVLSLLLQNGDIESLIICLFQEPRDFLLNVLPFLRRSPAAAAPFAQKILRIVSSQLKQRCSAAQQLIAASKDTDSEQKAAAQRDLNDLKTVATALIAQARVMFDESRLPATSGDVTFQDVRFLSPFFGILPRSELKKLGLTSLLHFTATDAYNDEDLRYSLREAMVPFPMPLAAGDEPRGVSTTGLFTFLHEVIQSGSAANLVTIPMFKVVINVCLSLSRTFEISQVPTAGMANLLYEHKECKKCIDTLSQLSPIPSQLMLTTILMSRIHPSLVSHVASSQGGLLSKLARENTLWERDPQLWRGVVHFCSEHFDETLAFLRSLPDHVLIAALKEDERLCDNFKKEFGSNATFAHILSCI